MLDENCGRDRGRGWKTAKEEHTEAEVCLWSGDKYEEARKSNTQVE